MQVVTGLLVLMVVGCCALSTTDNRVYDPLGEYEKLYGSVGVDLDFVIPKRANNTSMNDMFNTLVQGNSRVGSPDNFTATSPSLVDGRWKAEVGCCSGRWVSCTL